jgi:hypothetical protein
VYSQFLLLFILDDGLLFVRKPEFMQAERFHAFLLSSRMYSRNQAKPLNSRNILIFFASIYFKSEYGQNASVVDYYFLLSYHYHQMFMRSENPSSLADF